MLTPLARTSRFQIADLLGWYGALAVLLGFLLVNRSLVSVSSPLYVFLNLTGSAGLISEGLHKRDYPTIALNCAWLLIALSSLLSR
jgi:hypothetical protein